MTLDVDGLRIEQFRSKWRENMILRSYFFTKDEAPHIMRFIFNHSHDSCDPQETTIELGTAELQSPTLANSRLNHHIIRSPTSHT
jgi:hypothetical protein